tara:strand:- start:1323 stop:1616 length:294 start_codon:yes stop_codon:yes gene_type:complete
LTSDEALIKGQEKMKTDQTEIDPSNKWTVQNDKGGYFRKGGPYHRGQIDAANSRARSPHYLNGRARIGWVNMSKEQRDQYHAGFNDWLLDEREGGAI